MMSPANYDVVPPDRTGWADPAGRLIDPDSHGAGRVGHLLHPRTNAVHSAALDPFEVWPAAAVKHRGGCRHSTAWVARVARQFVIQSFGKGPSAPRNSTL
jgi:hypothetical protein